MREKLKCGAESLQTDEKEFIFGARRGGSVWLKPEDRTEVRGKWEAERTKGEELRIDVRCTGLRKDENNKHVQAVLICMDRPEAEFINAQFRWGFWASSEFSVWRFPYTRFILQTSFNQQGGGGGKNPE